MSRRSAARDADFTAFMEQAGPALLRTAWLLTGDHHRAQELTQASLVKTYVAWPRVREGEALAYARRVLVNYRTDVWRATRRELVTDSPPEAGSGTSRRDAVTTSDDRDLVVRLLRTLPEQQRTVVVLRYYTDLSEQATAEVLGISVGAVKSAGSRGLAALRSALAAAEAADASVGPTSASPTPTERDRSVR
ncbi:SigE family RNA polymerase sigma factor [Terracoccus sp. 273MFTsu3.1]|uniref:SigE family RNA polymerase sigma factor n=1 Tax=Terracoccus sp. 273MFTsu3.1 TaxID=1172188 RepID=UPI00037E7F9B|nr:SigE family RNA polymerase sigma factor [Terracoccus sp. 273MFTsu3.1]